MRNHTCSLAKLLPLLLLSACASDRDWMMVPFTKADEVNPVLEPVSNTYFSCPMRGEVVRWEQKDVFNPAAVVREGKVYLLYRAEDSVGKYNGTSRIGLAVSIDGLHFARKPQPVLFPEKDEFASIEWEGGCEDPRIVEDDKGMYYMTYSAYDGTKARLLVATSRNLLNWAKHGSIFLKAGQEYADRWTKSGSIVTSLVSGKLIATRINGTYWMYFGDTDIYAATSDNLIDWKPLTTGKDKAFMPVFSPREGMFDSDLVEPGPPAILTEKGIVLIYNSRNHPEKGDTSLPAGTYAAGQILLSKDNPLTVIDRTDDTFFLPSQPYELTGQVNNVCFPEGLVFFNNRWFLYYGTADSKIAVAVFQPEVN